MNDEGEAVSDAQWDEKWAVSEGNAWMHSETKNELNNECKDDIRGFIYRDDARWENEKNNGDNEEGKGR